jgi:hypothetical protein
VEVYQELLAVRHLGQLDQWDLRRAEHFATGRAEAEINLLLLGEERLKHLVL